MSFFRRARPGPGPAALPAAEAVPVSKRPAAHDYAAEAETLVHYFDFTGDDVRSSLADCREHALRAPVGRVAWFVPSFDSPRGGGVHTILRTAEHMRLVRGTRAVFVVIGAADEAAPRALIAEAYPGLAAACEIVTLDRIDEVPELGPLDAAVATLWMTSLPVLFLRGVRRKLYLIQDWEPEFYPAGTTSELVRASYRFGFHAICNTAPLADAYRATGGTAEHFTPAVDPAVFHSRRPPRPPGDPLRVFCYARPGHPRNCFELAAAALRDVKAQFFERVDIVCAGAGWNPADFNLGGRVRNVGFLPYAETGDLYRTVDVGLALMATRHPSYIPIELMACGAAVVATRNPATEWLLRDGDTAFIADPTRSELSDAIAGALNDPMRRSRIAAAAASMVAERLSDWGRVTETIAAAILHA